MLRHLCHNNHCNYKPFILVYRISLDFYKQVRYLYIWDLDRKLNWKRYIVEKTKARLLSGQYRRFISRIWVLSCDGFLLPVLKTNANICGLCFVCRHKAMRKKCQENVCKVKANTWVFLVPIGHDDDDDNEISINIFIPLFFVFCS